MISQLLLAITSICPGNIASTNASVCCLLSTSLYNGCYNVVQRQSKASYSDKLVMTNLCLCVCCVCLCVRIKCQKMRNIDATME